MERRQPTLGDTTDQRPSSEPHSETSASWPRWLQHALVLLLCALLAVLMTQPLAELRRTHLIRSRDTMVHYWNGWWAKEALTRGLPLYYTNYIFYPEGVSLVYQNIAWLNVSAWLGLQTVMGGLAAYNTTLLLYLALCGFTAYLLARYLTGSPLAATLGAIVYQNWPARLTRMYSPNLVNTVCMPLSLLFLIRTLRKERWSDAVLTGVFVSLTGYARWQQLIPAAIVISIYLTVVGLQEFVQLGQEGWREGLSRLWEGRRRTVLLLLLAALVAALALLPPAIKLVQEQTSESTDLVETENLDKVADLFAYVTPPRDHPLLNRWTRPLHDRYYVNRSSKVAYVGLVALGLALLAMMKNARAALPWGAAGLCLLLLGLGPTLLINGQVYPDAPTLYALVDRVVPLSLIRVPSRFNVFLALPVAVLAGYGATRALAWAGRKARWARALLSLVLGLTIIAECLPGPMLMDWPPLSPYYDELAAETGDFAVFNAPIMGKAAKFYTLTQTRHHRPILQGDVSRRPDQVLSTINSNAWLKELSTAYEMSPWFPDVSRQLDYLSGLGVKVMLLQRTQISAERIAHWKRYLLMEPTYEDDWLVAYRTEPVAGRDFTLSEELAPDLGSIRVITSTGCVNPGGVLEVDVGWGTKAPLGQDYGVELAVTSQEGATVAERTDALSPGWPTGEWPADAIAWGYYTLSVPSTLPAGTYALSLALTDPTTGRREGTVLELGTVDVAKQPCTFPTPPEAVPTSAVYGKRLRLTGYELQRDEDQLRVRLHWRSEQRMETDYTIFVHVFDPQDKRPVAQRDYRPRQGAYPTQYWAPGDTVKDQISIALSDAPPGSYGVAVGVYDPTTMERLPLVTPDGPRPDGRFELPGETVVIKASGP